MGISSWASPYITMVTDPFSKSGSIPNNSVLPASSFCNDVCDTVVVSAPSTPVL